MRFLIDQPLSRAVAVELNRAGHDAVHVRELGMQAASHEEIFEHAAQDDRVMVSADTDFGTCSRSASKRRRRSSCSDTAANTDRPTRPRC